MFSFADAMTMSAKKDGIVNMGGFMGLREKELWIKAPTFNLMFEGFLTYGGMAGRDMNALAVGLREESIAQTLVIKLNPEGGIRAAEIGTLMADRDPQTRENRYPENEYVRLAIPGRVDTNNHMDVIAAALCNIWERRNRISSGYKII